MKKPELIADDAKAALWQRICSYSFDEDGTHVTFVRKLAEQQCWSIQYATHVIEQYRRFAFLATVAPPACPSEDVDEAWHLHLTYTRSYWDDFCVTVLKKPLHHQPSLGGVSEHRKHSSMYLRTLAEYRRYFGEEPPADIWPDVQTRFCPKSAGPQIDRRNYWIISKHSVRRRAVQVACFGLLPLAAVFVAAGWGPLSAQIALFDSPTYITIYAILFLLALLFAAPVRHLLRGPADFQVGEGDKLNPLAVAYLQEGRRRAVETAITSLIHRGYLAVETREESLGRTKSRTRYELAPTSTTPTQLTDLEKTIYDAVVNADKASIAYVQHAAKYAGKDVASQLRGSGYLLSEQARSRMRLLPPLLMYLLIAMNVVLLLVNFASGGPTALLLFMTIVAVIAAVTLARAPRRSRRGDKAIDALTTKYKLKRARTIHPSTLTPTDWVMLNAIFGAEALAACPVAGLHDALTAPPNPGETYQGTDSSGCGSTATGCSGDSCGDAGCSGGSGCGGGCGGGCGS